MKKITAILLCGIIIVMMSVVPAFAEGDTDRLNEPNDNAGADTLPEEENAEEDEILSEEEAESLDRAIFQETLGFNVEKMK